MISIIIPTYNGAELLKKYSIPSLLNQSITNWEAIIINDGSNDNTTEVVNDFISKDKRIRLIENKENLGLAASLNRGIEQATGEIIMILEHDDIFIPNKIEQQLDAFKNGAVICSCNAIVYNTKIKKFTKINGGNLSSLSFKKENQNILFPLPEENKKYLGIEDGIISARLEIAKTSKILNNQNYIHINEILVIMNSSPKTLSGQKNSVEMKKRYKNVLDFYKDAKNNHPELNKLIKFWKKHYLYNTIITMLPSFLRKIVYFAIDKLQKISSIKKIAIYKDKNSNKYNNLIEYRKAFD